MTDVDKLVQVIRDLHDVEATHVRSEPVRETFRGDTVWEGVVEVFSIAGHPTATTAYAWSHETDEGGRRYVAVLQVPPVASAVDAVRALNRGRSTREALGGPTPEFRLDRGGGWA